MGVPKMGEWQFFSDASENRKIFAYGRLDFTDIVIYWHSRYHICVYFHIFVRKNFNKRKIEHFLKQGIPLRGCNLKGLIDFIFIFVNLKYKVFNNKIHN